MRTLPLLCLLAACNDYNFAGTKDGHGRDGRDSSDGPGTDDDTDIGDGDEDDDGECDDADRSPGTVDVDDACVATPVGTFTPIVEWTNTQVGPAYTTPVVGQLTDDNGNGQIDDGDVPDVVVGASSGEFHAVSGDGARLLWSTQNMGSEPMTAAIGDLDADGWPEVVVAGPSGTMAVRGTNGAVMWTGRAVGSAQCGAVAIADLEADGNPEVIIGSTIFDGQTGTTRGRGAYGSGTGYSGGVYVVIGAAADIDQDGVQEVVVGNALYDADGNALWYNGQPDGFVAVADFDGDPYGEIVVTWTGNVRLQDDDGTVLWSGSYTGSTSGPPTVADFDGDGEPEIGVAGYGQYTVIDGDGSTLWTRTTQDYSSGFTGSAVFDFEGDGQAEAVYADENSLFVFDGRTGAVKLEETAHSSATCSEYPAIADVDNDGHAEILYTSYPYTGSETGLTVVGDADNSWMPAATTWNQHAYSITNIDADGSIPRVPDTNWLSYNSFRSGDLGAATGGALTDAVLELTEICNVECADGRLRVVVRLGNGGTEELPSGVVVSAYAYQGGVPVWIDSQSTTDAVASGSTSRGLVFDLSAADVPEGRVVFVADDDNGTERVTECHEDNNTLEVDDGLCP